MVQPVNPYLTCCGKRPALASSCRFALYDVPSSCVARTFRRLAIFCGGGIPAASLKDLANLVRDEHIRRGCGDGTAYLVLAPCHDFAPPGASAQSSTRAEPLAAAELPPTLKRKSPQPS